MDLRLALEGRLGLGQDEGRTRHAFDPAGDHHLGPVADHPGTGDDRVETRGAQAVHGQRRHGFGQARQQHRHARDVAVVLAGLVGAAEHHLVHGKTRMQVEQPVDRQGCHVVRAHHGKAAAVAADRRAAVGAKEDLGHERSNAGAGR